MPRSGGRTGILTQYFQCVGKFLFAMELGGVNAIKTGVGNVCSGEVVVTAEVAYMWSARRPRPRYCAEAVVGQKE